ncbi:MAG: sugar transferase [Terracidiphilus sp.]|nr:sugar transferase [Terracidiphilus sp.]
MKTKPNVSGSYQEATPHRPAPSSDSSRGDTLNLELLADKPRFNSHLSAFLLGKHLSPWSRSRAKRSFDCVCVLSVLPLLIPMLLAIGLAVLSTSSGPVLFLQRRMGRHGRNFTILKFRTMIHDADRAHHPVTTSRNQLFTPIGPFLRRWKLDELPQLLNVLAGHMSLVGPRPKLPIHAISGLPCRAGITGAATLAFAREEETLDRVPGHRLEFFYHSVVLPAKHRLDAKYMAQATFLSDLRILFESVFRRWDNSTLEDLYDAWAFEQREARVLSIVPDPVPGFVHAPLVAHLERPASSGQIQAI